MARTDTLSNFLTDIAIAIRKKTNTSSTINAANFDYEIGKIQPNIPSNTFIANRYTKSLSKLFSGQANLPDEFTLDISNLQSKISCSELFALSGNVFNLKTLNIIGDTSIITDFYRMFKCRPALEIINGTLDLSNATDINEMFSFCMNLIEVRFKEKSIKSSLNISYSSLLSDESIQSIINGLKDSSNKCTLKLSAETKSKLTQEQLNIISSKGWLLS